MLTAFEQARSVAAAIEGDLASTDDLLVLGGTTTTIISIHLLTLLQSQGLPLSTSVHRRTSGGSAPCAPVHTDSCRLARYTLPEFPAGNSRGVGFALFPSVHTNF